jgi:hypothetical protein
MLTSNTSNEIGSQTASGEVVSLDEEKKSNKMTMMRPSGLKLKTAKKCFSSNQFHSANPILIEPKTHNSFTGLTITCKFKFNFVSDRACFV